MSLLMDALKRAETAKQDAARHPPGSLPAAHGRLDLELITIDPARSSSNPLPDLAANLAALDADLALSAQSDERPVTAPPSRPTPTAQSTEPRDKVRNAFTAKLNSEAPSRLPLWLTLGALALAGLIIGGYVWYQTNTMSHGSLAVSQPPTPPVAPPHPQPTPPPVAQLPAERPVPSSTPLFARPEVRPQPALPVENPAPANTAIHLTKTRPETDSNLARGHASLQRGDPEQARLAFEQSLQRDPNNTDALLALAAIAARQGRPADADHLRQRAFVANPGDPATQAAILNAPATNADPQVAESRLKSLLASQPESAPLNFALGNLYSRQGRWAEAQPAYFNAVAVEGDNPDYLFNLAVSLDHLHQPRLAAQHYRLALQAATRRPAGFERDTVEKRLADLSPERQP